MPIIPFVKPDPKCPAGRWRRVVDALDEFAYTMSPGAIQARMAEQGASYPKAVLGLFKEYLTQHDVPEADHRWMVRMARQELRYTSG